MKAYGITKLTAELKSSESVGLYIQK